MTFEAAARHASFTIAAAELGITQAAVSRQVHALEQQFERPLFRRLHRKVELTPAGRTLSLAASSAFETLVDAVAEMTREEQSDELTIAATVAFSHFWLLPRIAEFGRLHPAVRLRIVTQDAPVSMIGGQADLAIRYGNGLWPDGQSTLLSEDEVFPVCSPSFLVARAPVETLDQLADLPLVDFESDDPSWIGWSEWLAAFSRERSKRRSGLRCSFYTEVIYAALAGHGVALGWRRLVDDFLRQGQLVRLTSSALETRSAYFIVTARGRAKKATVGLFIDWLREQWRAEFWG
jgi:DNA-binding transcriptional LysR family regulator